MGCYNNIFMAEKFVRSRRFSFKNIQRRSRYLAGYNGVIQRIFNHQATPRAIDDANTFLAFRQSGSINDMPRLLRQRRMQRDEIRAPENVLKLNLLNSDFNGALRRQVGIKGNHFHLQAQARDQPQWNQYCRSQ